MNTLVKQQPRSMSSDTELKTQLRCFPALSTYQVTKVAQGVPGQLHDALCETSVMADESGEDGGQAIASSVQHDSGGSSPYCCFRAATPCNPTGSKNTECLYSLLPFDQHSRILFCISPLQEVYRVSLDCPLMFCVIFMQNCRTF